MTRRTVDLAALLRPGQPDFGPSSKRMATQRVRLLESMGPHAQQTVKGRSLRRLGLALGLGFAAATAAGTALVALDRESQEQARQLTAKLAGSSLSEGAWIETQAQEHTVEFSEGSRVRVLSKSKARIGILSPQKADIMLESGKLHARITKETGIHWAVAAGPYRVQVVGTDFDVEWDFSKQRFEVGVRQGKVRVTGGDLPAAGVIMTKGQSLLRSGTTPKAATAAPETTPSTPDQLPADPATSSRAAPRTSAAALVDPTWQQQARAGKYADALKRAQEEGIFGLLSTLPADDLLLLANTARYTGDVGTARAAFLKLRELHAGHSASSLAAFSLGRLASDSSGKHAEAARWFRIFLRESPRGDLAAGARARLMDALLKLGDQAGAKAVARDYLNHHPDGPHTATASALVSSIKSR